MSIIRYLFRQSSGLFLAAAFLGVVCGLSGAGLARVISESITGGGDVVYRAYLFFGLCALYLASKSCSEIFLLRLTQKAALKLRLNLSRRILATSYKKLQSLGKSELLVMLTQDITTFVGAYQMMPLAFSNTILIGACFGYMCWLSWHLFLLFALVLVTGMSVYHIAERGLLRRLAILREHMQSLYSHFRGLIEGCRELQLNVGRGTRYIDDVIAAEAKAYRQSLVRTMSGYTWIINIGAVLFYGVIGVLLFIAPFWLKLPTDVLTTFTLILLFLIRPVTEIMSVLPGLRQAGIAFRRIEQIQGSLPVPPIARDAIDPFASSEPLRLTLLGVTHNYTQHNDEGQFAVGPVDLTIEAGKTLFIVGGNGSGKTTLAMLLLGFYKPDAGQIVLNGVVVDEVNLSFYRQRFSAVFADFYLFEELLDTDIPEVRERARAYLEKLRMTRNVRVTGNRFSTTALSTGQRKRLALVSAYLEDRPVYVFDEWAADQDPTFKKIFYTILLPELKALGKAVVVITHDDAYFSYADEIIKLENGVRGQYDHDAAHDLLPAESHS
jgi:putative ATP-binding cassette transporter